MPRTRNPCPADFRDQIVALHRAGRSIRDLADEFEPCAETIYGWVKQADRDGGKLAAPPHVNRDAGRTSIDLAQQTVLRAHKAGLSAQPTIKIAAANVRFRDFHHPTARKGRYVKFHFKPFRDDRISRCKPASGEYVRKYKLVSEKAGGRFGRNRSGRSENP